MATSVDRPSHGYKRTWIKYTKGLANRSEIRRLSVICPLKTGHLSEKRRIVVALCMEFWSWMDDETVDGKCHITFDDIDEYLGCEGFAKALEEVGWLTQLSTGIELPRWDKHNGESAKKRAEDSYRKAKQRSLNNGVPDLSGESWDKCRSRAEESITGRPGPASPDLGRGNGEWTEMACRELLGALGLPPGKSARNFAAFRSRLAVMAAHPQRDDWLPCWVGWASEVAADGSAKNPAAVLMRRIGDDIEAKGVRFENGKPRIIGSQKGS